MNKFKTAFFIFLLLVFVGFSPIHAAQSPKDAYHYLKDLRNLAGLKGFQKSLILEKSAQDQADYMSFNRIISHFQSPKNNYFTGKTAADRAKIRGYESRTVTENISVGQKNYRESIDALFETLYHRLMFLSLKQNEIGIAGQKKQTDYYVYNIGNQQLNKLCSYSAINNSSSSYYTNVCNHLDRVPVKQLDDLETNTQKNNPPIIIWPPDLSRIATIGFWEEHPNPLSENQISGYPITVQLNPFFFRNINFGKIELMEFDSGLILSGKLFTIQNDKHSKLSDHEFGFFPNKLLKWGTRYQVIVYFTANNIQQMKKWTFSTKNLSFPIISISGDFELVLLKSGQTYLIEIEANKANDMIKELKWEFDSNTHLSVTKSYNNLLELQLNGDLCKKANFMLNGTRGFTLQISKKTTVLGKYHNQNNKNNYCR
jgi:hypothetical protein